MKRPRLSFCCAVVILLVFLIPLSQAQEHLFSEVTTTTDTARTEKTQLPDSQAVLDAQSRTRKMMEQVDTRRGENRSILPDLPAVEALPYPQVPAGDISAIAERYKHAGLIRPVKPDFPELLVLVSLSMPEGALHKLIDQSGRAGATLVFLGLKDDSMKVMGEAVKKLMNGRKVDIAIHPPAFQQFSISQVPAFVLATHEAGNVLEDGCAKPGSFIKVSGDVSLDYALEYIERNSQEWAAAASSYHSRMVRMLQ